MEELNMIRKKKWRNEKKKKKTLNPSVLQGFWIPSQSDVCHLAELKN